MTEQKRTFAQIREQLHFDCVDLADKAEVNAIVVYKMLVGDPVKRWQAEDVLKALSEMTGITVTLDSVEVVLYPESGTSQ
jgi:hypothetical protein